MGAVTRGLLFAGLCVGVALAADPPAGDLKGKQTQNAEQFRLIKDQLLKLAQKLAVSDKPAERERAKVILASLELAARENVDGQFRTLVGELGKSAQSEQDLKSAIAQDGQLLKALQDMLSLLLTDDEAKRTKAEIKRTGEALKEARGILRDQETLRALTDAQKGDPAKLADAQKKLTERTEALAESMGGKAKADPKSGEPGKAEGKKAGEPKGGKSKEGEAKDGKGKDGKQTDGKSQSGESKDGKSKDGKPSEKSGKAGEPKDGEPKDGQPKSGQGKQSEGKPSQPKDGQKQAGEQPQSDQPQTPPLPGRQRIEQAIPQQKGAADDLKEQKKPDAGKKQDKAIDEIGKAVQELEKRLKQMREEEAMRQLAGLEARCNRMAQLQQAVLDATKAIDKAVQEAGGAKSTTHIQKAQEQSDREREIVFEADKTLDLLKAEGSAVAFAGVLVEVRADMAAVQQRLTGADVGAVTQEVEANIVALLKEMAAALKKQQQDMQQQQQQAQQNPSGPQPNQALVNKIAELKMLRSMQENLNRRTKLVAAKASGEQTTDPKLAADLRGLAERQQRIQEMMVALATGANQ